MFQRGYRPVCVLGEKREVPHTHHVDLL
jgi:hypothetical protein